MSSVSRLPPQQQEDSADAANRTDALSAMREPISNQRYSPPTSPLGSESLRGMVSPSRSARRQGIGWVTLVKGGHELVRRRERLSAGQRQLHLAQWARRQRTDRSIAAQAATAAKLDARFTRSASASVFEQELKSDPGGVAFAFGGIDPGTLHAHGQLHEVHRAHYSIGRVGTYLLYVQLRAQALPLPGSPFVLRVSPGPAHAQTTRVLQDLTKLSGPVGLGDEDGCSCIVAAFDKMGNACVAGGANVKSMSPDADIESRVKDNGDGSYTVEWRSKNSGVFEVHVAIDKLSILGSPLQIRLVSTVPDLSKTSVSGSGIEMQTAGEPVQIHLSFVDEFSNTAVPSISYTFGLALLPEKSPEKLSTAIPYEFEGQWSADGSGDYTITYTASKAGNTELLLWCDTKGKGERVLLPGAPFSLLVQSGPADPDVSEVDGFVSESRNIDKVVKPPKSAIAPLVVEEKKIVAGDCITIKPSLRDLFGNPASVPDGELTVHACVDNGDADNESEDAPAETLVPLQTVIKAGLAIYECRHETSISGPHCMHVRLNGNPIKGSPVRFFVSPTIHEVAQTLVADFDGAQVRSVMQRK